MSVSLNNKHLTITIVIIWTLLAQLAFSQSKLEDLLPEIERVIQKGKENIWDEIEPNEPLWNMPPWLGTFFLSEYYFELKALALNSSNPFPTQFNQAFFTAKLLKEQLPDGSWKQLIDENQKSGSLDATIFNYWYLKQVGTDVLSPAMKNARKFILDHGGIEKAQMMTKYKLAVFGQYQWHLVNYIPLFLFKKGFPLYSYGYIKDYVGQWVYPHIIPLAYLRYHKTVFPVSKACISELMVSRGHPPCLASTQQDLLRNFNKLNNSTPLKRDPDVDNMLEEAINLYGRRGAFGAYTISTVLTLLCFKDYQLRYSNEAVPVNNNLDAENQKNQYITFFNRNINKSLTFIEENYFNRRVPYEGSLDDGRYWDTILATFALLEAGQNPQRLHPTLKYLVDTAIQPNGGIPYGHEFEYAPDIDDTGMLLIPYGKLQDHYKQKELSKYYKKQIDRSFSWVKSCQNSDGGFPAFDSNKNDGQYKFWTFVFWMTQIDKSAEIFDPSCPDIVGHVFEGMAASNITDYDVFTRGIDYLFKNRKDGMWSARWGINYVYAVGAVFPGLSKIGYNMSEPWITNITSRLMEVQQKDGGFGQDSDSYNKNKYVEGVTTASMTAWGLLAYLEVAHTTELNHRIREAALYLINNFKQNGDRFWDRSVVGTGHRGFLNLQYPVYAYSFPLVALSRLRAYIKNEGQRTPINQELMKRTRSITSVSDSDL